jgi:hypothetical protein
LLERPDAPSWDQLLQPRHRLVAFAEEEMLNRERHQALPDQAIGSASKRRASEWPTCRSSRSPTGLGWIWSEGWPTRSAGGRPGGWRCRPMWMPTCCTRPPPNSGPGPGAPAAPGCVASWPDRDVTSVPAAFGGSLSLLCCYRAWSEGMWQRSDNGQDDQHQPACLLQWPIRLRLIPVPERAPLEEESQPGLADSSSPCSSTSPTPSVR